MKTILVTTTDPFYNLALEEYILKEKNINDDVFFLWQNSPCVVIGRNQNPFNEVDLLYASAHNIPILRRISGGGTVYHDLGNINFTYITKKLKHRLNNYEFFLQPIISILSNAGIPVKFVPSSHIYIGDHKISGNAQSFHKDKMIHHGTLLFDGDLSHLEQLLKPLKRYHTHSVDSTRATTTNIKSQLPFKTDIESFKEFLLSEMLFGDSDRNVLELTKQDYQAIETLANTKYKSNEWTLGETPEFQINETLHGEVIQMRIVRGRIEESSIFPDELDGRYFLPQEIEQALPQDYPVSELLQLLF